MKLRDESAQRGDIRCRHRVIGQRREVRRRQRGDALAAFLNDDLFALPDLVQQFRQVRLGCEGPDGFHDGVSPNWLIELVYHRDVPGSPAVDRDGTMVDLYGYTSMLVAAVQAQGEALAKLQTELAQVKRRLRAK